MNKYLLFLFFICNNIFGQELSFKIYNKTGYDIRKVKLGQKTIPIILKDSSIVYAKCKKVSIKGQAPFGIVKAKIKERKDNCKGDGVWFCGTGIANVTKGSFEVDITMEKYSKSGYNLFWKKHE